MWMESGAYWKAVAPGTQVNTIKPGVYQYRSSLSGWYLERIRDRFEFPFRVFHFDDTIVDRICSGWRLLTEGNLGVLLNGVKGTGKTVSAQLAANAMIDLGIPVILVNDPIPMGDVLEEIHQEVVLFYDEFEKTHHRDEDQQRLLSVLDGVSRSKYRRMYLLVTNEASIDKNLLDRPGRIRYKFEFDGLKREHLDMIVDAYLAEDQKGLKDEIVEWLLQRQVVSVDAVIKTIEEVNAFKESPFVFESFFNLSERPVFNYRISVSLDGDNWEDFCERFSFQNSNGADFLKGLIAGTPKYLGYLVDPERYKPQLSFTDIGGHHGFFIDGKTSVRNIFTGKLMLRAGETWLKEWFKRVSENEIGSIYYNDWLLLDKKPEGWTCPLTLADIDANKELTGEAFDRMVQYNKFGTVYGGEATQFFIRVEPIHLNFKVSSITRIF